MDSPPSFRQAPKKPETLLSPEAARAQNEALARQVARAESALLRSQMARGQYQEYDGQPALHAAPKLPTRYALPVVAGVLSGFFFPMIGVSQGKSMLIAFLSALLLFALLFIQDVNRWLHK